jgi:hypothetical protein
MPNYDEKTGIRYGVISPHAISNFALDEIYTNGTDPQYEEGKTRLTDDITKILNGYGFSVGQIDEVLSPVIDIFNESYENDGSGIMDYSDKDYDLHVSGDNFGIFVMRSPYYTFCRGCSPCAPGAGDLNNPLNTDEHEVLDIGDRALCLGPEWFDTDNDQYSHKIPYRVFRVDTDEEVVP